ncbi:MAG TPA: DUF4139 domain-containing protein [Planctomycetales bacterium]|jgi:hypothetical protein|nr:DUF4139 domain-containing protein [Planctomycetales bacterium]
MRRSLLLVAGTGLAAVAGATAYFLAPSQAAGPLKPGEPVAAHVAAAPSETSVQLPIGQVVLFSSGVGYFQREGQIDGDARVDLSFPTQDINDLIKSMVLRDMDGGHVSAVSYDSNAPVEKTLQSFAINLSANPTFAQVLNQARGEKIEVVLQQANAAQPGTMTGAVMGVEKQRIAAGKEPPVEVEQLNMWCADGMRSVKLADVQRVRFLNPIMDNEVRKALETLTLSHDTQKKAVSLNFVGEGKRNVRVGYVIENPIWKTSYRLVLGKAKEDKPFLQGWAVVENATDEDWKDVRMALVSGRPISFQMDLYTPLYVPRPTVVPELFASLRPVTYNDDLKRTRSEAGAATPPLAPAGAVSADESVGGGFGGGGGLAMPAEAKNLNFGLQVKAKLSEQMKLGAAGVSTMATATKLGDFFQYALDKPVSLPRQKSALLPIVNKDVEGTRVSIYNERTQAKFPLLGLKFKNTSGLHLSQGPITVFEGSNYAGDSRILDVEPNEERLLSYAVDLGMEVNPVVSNDNGRITTIKVVKGILESITKLRETKTYTIVNRNDAERLVLVEHPVRNDFHLTDDTSKPAETASDVYRFEVKVAAGKTAAQTVTEERVLSQQFSLTNSGDDQIRIFLNATVASPKVKAGLKQAIDLRAAMNKTQRDIAEQQLQLATITTDQTRLRANLKEMPPTAAAYKRYLDKFDQQETQIETFQAAVKKLQETEHQQKKEFEDFLANFTAE